MTKKERKRLDILLSKGLCIYTHYPEEYAYLGAPGENRGCLSYKVSPEYVEKKDIPVYGLEPGHWFEFPNGEEYPEGFCFPEEE